MFLALSYSIFRAAHVFLYLDKNQAVLNDKIMIIKNQMTTTAADQWGQAMRLPSKSSQPRVTGVVS